MTASTFDTHAAVIALRNAGIDEAQAEAIVNTMRDAAGASRSDLATKADLPALREDIAALRADFYRALWIQGGAIVIILGGFITIAASLDIP